MEKKLADSGPAVNGNGFIAKVIGFENSVGPNKASSWLGGLFVVGVSDGGSGDGVRVVEKWGEVVGEGLWVWRDFLVVYDVKEGGETVFPSSKGNLVVRRSSLLQRETLVLYLGGMDYPNVVKKGTYVALLQRCVHFNRMIDEKFGTLDVRLRGLEKIK
uniref:Uncharacterized protein n=1 Tax=Tanacetum cinerariifolium TaxID=118510 RepID=A0A699H3D2_TANCI|nr:hypothetical protein [Tanacetum cinerariifolium]